MKKLIVILLYVLPSIAYSDDMRINCEGKNLKRSSHPDFEIPNEEKYASRFFVFNSNYKLLFLRQSDTPLRNFDDTRFLRCDASDNLIECSGDYDVRTSNIFTAGIELISYQLEINRYSGRITEYFERYYSETKTTEINTFYGQCDSAEQKF